MSRKLIRCAVYTRKSSDEGLDQSFNSLDAQREAGEAYAKSQAHEGWRVIPTRYDDGGYSGGTMERPALQKLLADVDAGLIDVVVVYKIDRLTRSLPDFARIVERFDNHEVSFVSVTQSFNTTSSMGRLTLNVLLSFAQFEREVTGERIRDKIAASKAKGMWMGGTLPLGYDLPAPGTRILRVNAEEAKTVRHIFTRYLDLGSVQILRRELAEQGVLSKRRITRNGKTLGGKPINRGALFHMLRNPVYLGKICHKGVVHDGGHEAIVEEDLFDRVQRKLENQTRRHNKKTSETRFARSPLTGKLFDASGEVMTPSFTNNRHGRSYRYYVSASLQTGAKPPDDDMVRRLSGPDIEKAVAALIERWVPTANDPIALPSAIRLEEHGLLVELPAQQASDIAGRLNADEHIIRENRQSIAIRVPLALPLRGGKRMIIAGQEPMARPDPVLIAALRRAHAIVTTRRNQPVVEKAPASTHARNLLRLAFLAPDLQRDILAGRQPPSLNLEKLRGIDIPLCWHEQRQALGWPVTR